MMGSSLILWASIAVVLLLAASAILSAGEAAVFSVSKSRLRTIEEEGFDRAEALVRLRSEPDRVRNALILCNVVLNIVAAGIIVAAAVQLRGPIGAWFAIPLAAFGTVALGELLPRAVATRRPVSLALSAAPGLLGIERIVRPILVPLTGFREMLGTGEDGSALSAEERELRDLAERGKEEGIVGEDEQELVERAFRLDELRARDVMTPRVAIFAWHDALTLGEIVDDLKSIPYSRVPVFGESVDDVTGILYVREAYQHFVAGHRDVPLSRISREPLFVPGSVPLTKLLRDFQTRRIHMGIVGDEFGGTDGLVTLEDVLEELVGEIHDETDEEQELLVRVGRGRIAVSGNTELREIHHAYNVSLPYLEHRTVNGLLLEELGHVPQEGEELELGDCTIQVLEASDTQVLRAVIQLAVVGEGDEAA